MPGTSNRGGAPHGMLTHACVDYLRQSRRMQKSGRTHLHGHQERASLQRPWTFSSGRATQALSHKYTVHRKIVVAGAGSGIPVVWEAAPLLALLARTKPKSNTGQCLPRHGACRTTLRTAPTRPLTPSLPRLRCHIRMAYGTLATHRGATKHPTVR